MHARADPRALQPAPPASCSPSACSPAWRNVCTFSPSDPWLLADHFLVLKDTLSRPQGQHTCCGHNQMRWASIPRLCVAPASHVLCAEMSTFPCGGPLSCWMVSRSVPWVRKGQGGCGACRDMRRACGTHVSVPLRPVFSRVPLAFRVFAPVCVPVMSPRCQLPARPTHNSPHIESVHAHTHGQCVGRAMPLAACTLSVRDTWSACLHSYSAVPSCLVACVLRV